MLQSINPSRFQSFREATNPEWSDGDLLSEAEPAAGTRFDAAAARKKKVKPVPGSELAIAEEILAAGGTVADIVKEIGILTPDIVALAGEAGMGADALALKIDANLGARVWAGTKFEDRMGHMVQTLRTDLIQQMENSLMAQERYEDFELRTSKALGIDTDEKMGPLQKFWNQVNGEAKLAWNEGMIEANMGADTALVWRSALRATTTPGCAARHSSLIYDELGGEFPPKHWGCVVADTVVAGSVLAAFRMLYNGKVRKIVTRSGHKLTVTPNHPIMTMDGMKPAGDLNEGDNLLTYDSSVKVNIVDGLSSLGVRSTMITPDDKEYGPTRIDEVFKSLAGVETKTYALSGRLGADFDGDAQFGQGNIEIVTLNSELLNNRSDIKRTHNIGNVSFEPPDACFSRAVSHDGNSDPSIMDSTVMGTPPRLMQYGKDLSRLLGFSQPIQTGSFGNTSDLDSVALKSVQEQAPRDASFAGKLIKRLPHTIAVDQIIKISEVYFIGHVYDLSTITGLIVANGIIISNCLCDVFTIPNPHSQDEDRAAQGQAVLDAMKAERDAWGGDLDKDVESARPFIPSRFKYFREAQGPDDEEGHWVTIRGNPVFLKGPAPEKQTDTAAFKKWFGDSRVVDKDGQPLRVYHGGDSDIVKFDLRKVGTGRGGSEEKAFFFSRDAETANVSAYVTGGDTEGAVVLPVYLSVRNPYISKMPVYNSKEMEKELRTAKSLGHDGVFFPNITTSGESGTIAVFNPRQIKSAIGNKGTFNPKIPFIIESCKPSRFLSFHEADRWRADDDEFSEAWDEEKHPRGKTTPDSTPGSFAPGSGTQPTDGEIFKNLDSKDRYEIIKWQRDPTAANKRLIAALVDRTTTDLRDLHPGPVTLYRGGFVKAGALQSWTTSRAVAVRHSFYDQKYIYSVVITKNTPALSLKIAQPTRVSARPENEVLLRTPKGALRMPIDTEPAP